MEIKNNIAAFHARNRKEWRKWLEKNHLLAKNVWLIIYHKRSATPSVYYDEAVEEALCFGWVDSKPNKRDEESFYLFFSQRNAKSNWSKLNKERVEKLSRLGLMHDAGLAMVQLAKESGTWTALEEIDQEIIPADLQKALQKNKTACKNFEAFPPSARKGILSWIQSAKQEETRKKRIAETVSLAAQNIRANQYVKK